MFPIIVMHKILLISALVLGSGVACQQSDSPRRNERIAEESGWLANYKRGREIIQELAALGPSGQKIQIAAYRQERVAFVGGGAPPGATNDLIIGGGFYLRVVNKAGKDLRPQAVWWEVMVCGEILQVLPENKIIVLQVEEKDWIILQTG